MTALRCTDVSSCLALAFVLTSMLATAFPSSGQSPQLEDSAVPQSDVVQTYASSLTSLASGMRLMTLFTPPDQAITNQYGPVLANEAEEALLAGYQGVAIELMYGHMVSEYDQAIDKIQTVKYSPLIREPVWNIRWGISIWVRGDAGAEGAQPIPDDATTPGIGNEDPSMFNSEMGAMSLGGDARSNILEDHLGLVATMVAEEFGRRYSGGEFGSILTNVAPPPPVVDDSANGEFFDGEPGVQTPPPPPMISEALGNALRDAPEPLPIWKPGILFIGEGKLDEVLPIAKNAGIDLLFHFDVILKMNRAEKLQNVSRCRFVQVDNAKSLAISKAMDNIEVAQLAATGRTTSARDYVRDQMSGVWALVNRHARVVELPALTGEIAKHRIATLITTGDTQKLRTLRTLAEIRYYQFKELISPEEVETAFNIVGGDEALILLYGAPDERLAMARTWAVEAQRVVKD